MANRCRIDVIDTMDRLVPLESDWTAVYEADPESHYFLSWTWMSNWLPLLQTPWLVLAARPAGEDRYGAFLPLQIRTEMRSDGRFTNGIAMGGHNLAGYTGFLCDPACVADAMPAFAEFVAGLNWTTIHLDTTPNSEARLRLFTDRFATAAFEIRKFARRDPAGDANYSIYPYIALPGDFETFLTQNLNSKTRYNARSALRQLDGGAYRISDADAGTIDAHLEALLGLWQEQWKPTKGETVTAYEVTNHRAMLKACFAAGAAMVSVLWQGDAPIGADGVILDRKTKTMLGLVSSRDITVKGPSPNFLLRLHLVRWGIAQGFATYDLLQGNHAHKYKFGPKERVLDSQAVLTANGRNLRGKLEPRTVVQAFGLAQVVHRSGDLARATMSCRQILEVDPDHAGAHEILGTVALQRKDVKTAERELGLAVRLDPDAPMAQYHHGVALLALGQVEQAVERFDKAIALQPDLSAAHKSREVALQRLRRSAASAR